jgi:hypothetical protein
MPRGMKWCEKCKKTLAKERKQEKENAVETK